MSCEPDCKFDEFMESLENMALEWKERMNPAQFSSVLIMFGCKVAYICAPTFECADNVITDSCAYGLKMAQEIKDEQET